jgi:PAS domain S-box-containing protein
VLWAEFDWVTAAVVPFLIALGAVAARVWPLVMRDRAERHQQALQSDEARTRQEREGRDAEERHRQEAHEQVRQEYADFFTRQRGEIDVLRRDRARADARIEKLFEELRGMTAVHAECLVKNERLAARVELLQETLDRVQARQSEWQLPTRNEAVVIVDQLGVIRQWNEAAVAIFHWKTHEVIGREVWVLATTETRQAFKEAWRRVLESGKPVRRGPYYVEAVTKGGEPVPVEVVLSSWTEAGETADGRRRVFCASIRQRPRGPRGETAEDRVDLESMRALPSPASDLLRQAVSPPPLPGPGESTVGVQPSPDGGADIHVPPGAKAIVRQDGVGVEVDPSESKAPPPGPKP